MISGYLKSKADKQRFTEAERALHAGYTDHQDFETFTIGQFRANATKPGFAELAMPITLRLPLSPTDNVATILDKSPELRAILKADKFYSLVQGNLDPKGGLLVSREQLEEFRRHIIGALSELSQRSLWSLRNEMQKQDEEKERSKNADLLKQDGLHAAVFLMDFLFSQVATKPEQIRQFHAFSNLSLRLNNLANDFHKDCVTIEETAKKAGALLEEVPKLKLASFLKTGGNLLQIGLELASILGGQQDPTLAAIREVQQQLSRFEEAMHGRFDALDSRLSFMTRLFSARFDEISAHLKSLSQDVARVESRLVTFSNIYLEDRKSAQMERLKLWRDSVHGPLTGPCLHSTLRNRNAFQNCLAAFRHSIDTISSDQAWMGSHASFDGPSGVNYANVHRALQGNRAIDPTTSILNPLMETLATQLGEASFLATSEQAHRSISTAHPGEWNRIVEVFVGFLIAHPEFSRVHARDIQATAEHILNAVMGIKTASIALSRPRLIQQTVPVGTFTTPMFRWGYPAFERILNDYEQARTRLITTIDSQSQRLGGLSLYAPATAQLPQMPLADAWKLVPKEETIPPCNYLRAVHEWNGRDLHPSIDVMHEIVDGWRDDAPNPNRRAPRQGITNLKNPWHDFQVKLDPKTLFSFIPNEAFVATGARGRLEACYGKIYYTRAAEVVNSALPNSNPSTNAEHLAIRSRITAEVEIYFVPEASGDPAILVARRIIHSRLSYKTGLMRPKKLALVSDKPELMGWLRARLEDRGFDIGSVRAEEHPEAFHQKLEQLRNHLNQEPIKSRLVRETGMTLESGEDVWITVLENGRYLDRLIPAQATNPPTPPGPILRSGNVIAVLAIPFTGCPKGECFMDDSHFWPPLEEDKKKDPKFTTPVPSRIWHILRNENFNAGFPSGPAWNGMEADFFARSEDGLTAAEKATSLAALRDFIQRYMRAQRLAFVTSLKSALETGDSTILNQNFIPVHTSIAAEVETFLGARDYLEHALSLAFPNAISGISLSSSEIDLRLLLFGKNPLGSFSSVLLPEISPNLEQWMAATDLYAWEKRDREQTQKVRQWLISVADQTRDGASVIPWANSRTSAKEEYLGAAMRIWRESLPRRPVGEVIADFVKDLRGYTH